MGGARFKDFFWGLVIAAMISAMVIGVLLLRRQNTRSQTMRGAALEAIDHVVYVNDAKASRCFAFTWVVAENHRVYLFAWVPCQLPVATQPEPALDEMVPL